MKPNEYTTRIQISEPEFSTLKDVKIWIEKLISKHGDNMKLQILDEQAKDFYDIDQFSLRLYLKAPILEQK